VPGMASRISSSLRWVARWWRAWVCWMTKTMVSVSAATRVWKMISHRAGNPAAMLMAIHTVAAVTTATAASGRDACRSTLDSHRLMRERSADGFDSVTGIPPISRYFSPSFLASSSRPIFDLPGRSRCRAISYSSARVLGEAPPVRLRRATAAPCLPSAVRVFAGRCVIVFASRGLLGFLHVAPGRPGLLARRHGSPPPFKGHL
jgi:hypothetical protein